ncbi:MAG: ATP-dependent protease LonB, partial [Methanoregula sp.]
MENSEPAVPAQEEAVPQVPQPEPAAPGAAEPQPEVSERAAVVTEGASSQIEVPAKLIDQVIGQERAVEVIRKAATQRRHVMMIGSPGT